MSNIELTDDLLIKKYIEGNENALNILIKRHESRIYGFIHSKIPDRETCNDIFQDTFVKVIKTLKSGSYSEQGKFLSWITKISHNLAMDYFRENKFNYLYFKSIEEGTCYDSVFDETPSVENRIIINQIKNDLKKILEKLPPEQKEIIILKMYHNMSHKEIAELKNISINTSLGRMRYAIINLRKIIKINKIILTN